MLLIEFFMNDDVVKVRCFFDRFVEFKEVVFENNVFLLCMFVVVGIIVCEIEKV